MEKEELIDALEDAGLSPYQAEAYVTVLELGSASATDIAETSTVPDPRIYDVLRDLEKDGYVETYEQDSLHARAYSPEVVLKDLRSRAKRFEDAADEIENRWEEPEMDTHTVSFVKRIDTVLDKAETKIESAETQIQIALSRSQLERLRPALERAHERGVHIRLALHVDSEADLPGESEMGSVVTEAQYRLLPMPFVALIDRTAACFAPHDLSMNRYGIIVEDRTHAYVFHWFFMAGIWESTKELYAVDDSSLPRSYVDVRNCIYDIAPLIEDGATIEATIYAFDVETGTEVTLKGTVSDVIYPKVENLSEDIPFAYIGGQATLLLDTGEKTCKVGGWGALVEEFEATRIVIESISYE